VVATNGSDEAVADLVVDPAAAAAGGTDVDALAAWAASRGGRSVTVAEVAGAIPSAEASSAPVQPWHPMRSVWWIAPMTLLTGIEWWTRRRTGLK